MSGGVGSGAGDEGVEVGPFLRLDQPEVAGGVGEVGQARQAAEDGEARGCKRAAEHRLVPWTAHAVEDDARDTDSGVVAGKAQGEGGHGLGHAGGVDHEDHGEVELAGEVGGGAAALGGRAVEEAHGAFDQEGAIALRKRGNAGGCHGPGIEVQAGAGAGGFVKAGVDVVGAGFRGTDGQAPVAEGTQ